MGRKTFKTDWLTSKPVFYNEKTLKISHNINDVIDWSNIEFHPEGLNNYLDFGYSVFQQTPLKNIKFLKHSSEIWVENNKLKIVEKTDPVIKWFEENKGYRKEEEVLELIKAKVQRWESNIRGNIILPLSGGYDSRLLAYFIKDKSRIRAYTYGVSFIQSNSCEVVYAKEVANRLNIDWRQIELGNYHNYFDRWDDLYGISTHAHGMYHIEFYEKILEKKFQQEANFLSGIFGDVWAGSVPYQSIPTYENLERLGYTHGLHANSAFSKLAVKSDIRKEFFLDNKELIHDDRSQIILTIRLKMILISYLTNLPKEFSLDSWSPYLDMDVALSMLSISPQRRRDRVWQKEFFKEVGLDIEDTNLRCNKINNLNHQALENIRPEPLNIALLEELIETKYLLEINKILLNTPFVYSIIPLIKKSRKNTWLVKKIISGLEMINIKDKIVEAYCAYLTLKPIENVLYKRNKYLKENKP